MTLVQGSVDMVKGSNFLKRLLATLLFAPLTLWLVYIGAIPYIILILIVLTAALAEYCLIILNNKINRKAINIALIFVGVFIIFCSFISLFYLRNLENGFRITIWFISIVWCTDISGYVFGKLIGGPKIFPVTSPNKTYAGAIFGIITSVFLYLFIKKYFYQEATLLITLLISISSQVGDFFESKFKRKFKIKDSGRIIPGHGGMLDRIDGMLAASIMLAVYFYFFK